MSELKWNGQRSILEIRISAAYEKSSFSEQVLEFLR